MSDVMVPAYLSFAQPRFWMQKISIQRKRTVQCSDARGAGRRNFHARRLSGFIHSDMAGVQLRLDRHDDRFVRIEKRLDFYQRSLTFFSGLNVSPR